MEKEKLKLRCLLVFVGDTILAFLITFLAYSCANIQEETTGNDNNATKEQTLEVLNYDSGADSLKVRELIQSDIDVIMVNHISLKDGVYTLSLSKDDALSLGADEAKYMYYKSMVDRLNKTE